MTLEQAEILISAEAASAAAIWPPFNSAHEGYAVIKEEFEELWDEIKRNPRHPQDMTKEAIHTGAMVLRFLTDLC